MSDQEDLRNQIMWELENHFEATGTKLRAAADALLPLLGQPRTDDPIPRYAQLDVWMALYGTERSGEYETFREQHGFAETWARLCAAVRQPRTDAPLDLDPRPMRSLDGRKWPVSTERNVQFDPDPGFEQDQARYPRTDTTEPGDKP